MKRKINFANLLLLIDFIILFFEFLFFYITFDSALKSSSNFDINNLPILITTYIVYIVFFVFLFIEYFRRKKNAINFKNVSITTLALSLFNFGILLTLLVCTKENLSVSNIRLEIISLAFLLTIVICCMFILIFRKKYIVKTILMSTCGILVIGLIVLMCFRDYYCVSISELLTTSELISYVIYSAALFVLIFSSIIIETLMKNGVLTSIYKKSISEDNQDKVIVELKNALLKDMIDHSMDGFCASLKKENDYLDKKKIKMVLKLLKKEKDRSATHFYQLGYWRWKKSYNKLYFYNFNLAFAVKNLKKAINLGNVDAYDALSKIYNLYSVRPHFHSIVDFTDFILFFSKYVITVIPVLLWLMSLLIYWLFDFKLKYVKLSKIMFNEYNRMKDTNED